MRCIDFFVYMNFTLRHILIFQILFLMSCVALGQKQTHIWYFGNGAGIDFNTAPPTTLTNGAMFTLEGCSSIADSNGNLVFYTDGIKAWNKNHKVMNNSLGLMGGYDVTQSALIVPMPKNPRKYFLFTVEGSEYSKGFRYSVVNMDLNGGLGDIETDNKNVLVQTPVSEKITATHHANGRDIWVIVHGQEDASFYAYLITPAGIDPTPVVSNIGTKYNRYDRFKGQLKVSPEGKKLVCCNSLSNFSELFDFDNQSGKVSNLIRVPVSIAFGCEFSPDETKLYISQFNTFNISSYELLQFDITATDSSSIANSKMQIDLQSPRGFGSLQLGADKKIYVARHNSLYLGVIQSPNQPGALANYDAFGMNLMSNVSWYGLPNFVTGFFRTLYEVTFEQKNNCLADSNLFEFTGTANYDSLVWDFGDGTSSQCIYTNEIKHHFETEGTYEITIARWSGGKRYAAKQSVVLNKANVTTNVYSGCEGYSVQVGSNTYDKTGVYKDLLSECDTIISILTIYPKPQFSFSLVHDSCGKNTGIASVINTVGSFPFTYQWSNGSTDSMITGLQNGQYNIKVSDSHGCESDNTATIQDLRDQCSFYLYVPDAFSPNDDGLNDTYKVSAFYLEPFDLQIFNQWGELVFRTDKPNIQWDGTYENRKCKTGVYMVIINYGTKAEPGKSFQYKTTLQLIR